MKNFLIIVFIIKWIVKSVSRISILSSMMGRVSLKKLVYLIER